jgi:glycosyltransferase involved in cell wall biosynthesis
MSNVSVVIPTRDRPSALRRAIDSVLRQSFDDFEIVVVDDGSEGDVASAIVGLDARLSVVRNKVALGPAGARNRGVDASTAPVVAFLDDDDVWLPHKLSSVMPFFADRPDIGAVSHRVGHVDATAMKTGLVTVDPRPVRRFLLSQPPHLSGVAVRSELHRAVRFDETFGAAEDLDYLIRLGAVASFAFIDDIYCFHGERTEHPSMIGVERRIEARRQFRDKHDDLFDRRADAFHLMRMGHLYRTAGRRSSALAAFTHSALLCPTLGYAWRGIVLSGLPNKVSGRLVA